MSDDLNSVESAAPISALEIARRQIVFARDYTLTLLEDVADDEWFVIPSGMHTNFAWQVGHLAMAEYGLCLFRVRGRQSVDMELMSSAFRKKYSRGSTPDSDPGNNPSPTELRSTFDAVHRQSLEEMATYREENLQEPIDMPYAVFPNKLGALYFCASHELLHAGQIGMLRRAFGKSPVR
ncbi:MAG: DinB family protein [Planctomycetales bacterium]|nr:DinB family protein [Planctomycetales bacterium]